MSDVKVGKKWLEMKGIVLRKGMREGWFEMVVKRGDGSLVKMIGRKCGKFISEESEELDLGEFGKLKDEEGF